MSRRIGEAMTPGTLERVVGAWPVNRFTALCDAVTWAASDGRWGPMPQFTGRIHAADGGIDAEWDIELQPEFDSGLATPILGAGWNVLQYKQRDVGSRDRSRIVSDLKRSLTAAVHDVTTRAPEQHRGRPPDRYVLFTNVDLKGDHVRALRECILQDAPALGSTRVEIVGAALLAALLNDHPHLRAAFFSEGAFLTWERAKTGHRRAELARPGVETIVGREAEVESVREWAGQPELRVLIVTGPQGVGKSRLVLESLGTWQEQVVVALDPRSMALADYRALLRGGSDVIVVVEDAPKEQLDDLVRLALSEPGLRLVLTLPMPDLFPDSSFGRETRVRTLRVDPLNEERSRELLRATGIPIDPVLAHWIVWKSGGLPSILLTAASVGIELRGGVEGNDFRVAVGQELEERVGERFGDVAVDLLRALSVLSFVGVQGERHGFELDQLCRLYDFGLSAPRRRELLDQLAGAGLVAMRGSFAAVMPPLLANHLANSVFQSDPNSVLRLAAVASPSSFGRFLERLAQLPRETTATLWDTFFEEEAPLHDLGSAVRNPTLLRQAALAVPERVLPVLETGLINRTQSERLGLAGEVRRTTMQALDAMLVDPRTSRDTVRLIWLLADAENETWSNNATGVLAEVFHPMHPQIPIPIDERLPLARQLFQEAPSSHARVVLVEALGKTWESRMVSLRSTGAAAPSFYRSSVQVQAVLRYVEDRTKLLFEWSDHEDPAVQTAALRVLPPILVRHVAEGRYEVGLSGFERLVQLALDHSKPIAGSALSEALVNARWYLEHQIEQADESDHPAARAARSRIDELVGQLESSSVLGRLQVWASGWGHGELLAATQGESAPFFDHLRVAADELISTPSLLDDELADWLLSPQAVKGALFFHLLGKRDERSALIPRMREISQNPTGAYAFAAYMQGWNERDDAAVQAELDRLTDESDPDLALGVAYATILIGPSRADLSRLEHVLATGDVDPRHIAASLSAMGTVRRWIDGLEPSEFEYLLRSLAGPDLRLAAEVIHLLSLWHAVRRVFSAGMIELGWACLASEHALRGSLGSWRHDTLAAALAKEDPQGGFTLLAKLLDRDWSDGLWEPVGLEDRSEFLRTLGEIDRPQLLRLLLDIARRSTTSRYYATAALRTVLGHQEDVELLIEEALKSPEDAKIVAEGLDIEHPEIYWPVAFALSEAFPADDELKGRLSQVMRGRKLNPIGSTWSYRGSEAETLAGYRARIGERLDSAPPIARAWLREELARLSDEIDRKIVWEYDEEIADLRGYIEDPDSPRRQWAIARVLKYADWDEARRLLSLEDVMEALPRVDLPPTKRRALERALEIWRSEPALDR